MAFQTSGGRAFRLLQASAPADIFQASPGAATKVNVVMLGAKLSSAGAASTAQLVDEEGTVLADLAAPANGADYAQVPVIAVGKIRCAAMTGASSILNVWVL